MPQTVFINFSPISYQIWEEAKTVAAYKLADIIVDMKLPKITAQMSTSDINLIAHEVVHQIYQTILQYEDIIMGHTILVECEPGLCHAIVSILRDVIDNDVYVDWNIVYSTSQIGYISTDDGTKIPVHNFVQFREYPELPKVAAQF